MEQEELQAENNMEELLSSIERDAEEKLKKYIKPKSGDYVLTVSMEKIRNEIKVSAEVEVYSYILNKETLDSIADEIVSTIERSANEVIKLNRDNRSIKRGK